MELDHVEAFVAIVRRGGFTRAAAVLHLSQPAISRRLHLLEHELGAPLFDRVRAGAALTDAGRAFLPHAEALLASMRDGIEPAALAGERWITFPPRPGPGPEPYATLLQHRLAACGLGDAEVVHIDSLTAQKRMVEAGFGLALLAESSVDEELRRGTLRALPVA